MKIKTLDINNLMNFNNEFSGLDVISILNICQKNIDSYCNEAMINKNNNDVQLHIYNNRKYLTPHISIVIGYYNRYEQLETTLDTMAMSSFDNFEVIIVDDASEQHHNVKMLIYKYKFPISLVVVSKNQKTWTNPVIPYNIGLRIAKGEKIIIQNPEVCHVGDIISHVNDNLNKGTYFAYSVFSSPSFEHNKEISCLMKNSKNIRKYIKDINYNDFAFDANYYSEHYDDVKNIAPENLHNHYTKIGHAQGRKCNKIGIYHPDIYISWKGWYQHPEFNPRAFHFLSAITKDDLQKIGGFDNNFKNGLWYDDDDLFYRIKNICEIEIISPNTVYGIHLYHHNGSSAENIKKNGELITTNKNIYLANIKSKRIWTDIESNLTNINNYKLITNNLIEPNDFKVAICVKTYVDQNTKMERLDIIDSCLSSITKYNTYGDVLIFVDGVDVSDRKNDAIKKYHSQMLNKYKNSCNILKFDKNKGVAGISNYIMRYIILNGYDAAIICDDDIVVKKDFSYEYLKAILFTGIEHLSYYPFKELLETMPLLVNNEKKTYNINEVVIANNLHGYSGCIYTVTPKMIQSCGYMPIFNYKYGYEHEIFTKKYYEYKKYFGLDTMQGQFDMINSNIFLELNKQSFDIKSFLVDESKIYQNKLEADNINIGHFQDYNENSIKISIVIYYREHIGILESTIQSIIASLFYNFEIIIINNNSLNHEQLKILKEKYYHTNIKIINEHNNDEIISIYNCAITAKGDILIIQKQNAVHDKDLLSYTCENLAANNVVVFSKSLMMEKKEYYDGIIIKKTDLESICDINKIISRIETVIDDKTNQFCFNVEFIKDKSFNVTIY